MKPSKTVIVAPAGTAKPERAVYDSHMHTPLCKHATGAPEDYAQTAFNRGLKGVIFTCHAPLPNGYSPAIRMTDSEFEIYTSLVRSAAETWSGRIDVRLGIESDYLPELTSWLRKLHDRTRFDFKLGSIHPQNAEYRRQYYQGDPIAFQKQYFCHLAEAAESGLFDALAHPDCIKYLFPQSWRFLHIHSDIYRALDRIANTGVALEVNTSGRHKKPREISPGSLFLRAAIERGIPLVLGSDAHDPRFVGDQFLSVLGQLTELGCREISYFKLGRRHTIKVAAAAKSIACNATKNQSRPAQL